jgi:hypothetical protein
MDNFLVHFRFSLHLEQVYILSPSKISSPKGDKGKKEEKRGRRLEKRYRRERGRRRNSKGKKKEKKE